MYKDCKENKKSRKRQHHCITNEMNEAMQNKAKLKHMSKTHEITCHSRLRDTREVFSARPRASCRAPSTPMWFLASCRSWKHMELGDRNLIAFLRQSLSCFASHISRILTLYTTNMITLTHSDSPQLDVIFCQPHLVDIDTIHNQQDLPHTQ